MTNDTIVQTLNDLIVILKDADQGFHAAAEEVRDNVLKTELHTFGQRSATMWGELQGEVRQLGVEPKDDGTFSGKCKRIWMEVKTAFSDKDEFIVLKDCLAAQEAVQEGFDGALKTEGIPSNVKDAIGRHYNAMREITRGVQQHYDRYSAIQNS